MYIALFHILDIAGTNGFSGMFMSHIFPQTFLLGTETSGLRPFSTKNT